ncbi:MAG TPA: cytochrome b/b6 domain-containing protein [Mycobacteriales bacterium]|nr:cytochrome b/b6 domain-containing protein [Mycobacteriales bacterium]
MTAKPPALLPGRPRRSAETPRPDRLPRFTPAERWVHRSTGLLVAVLTVTGAGLYYEPLALLFSRRPLVEGAHIVAGLLLPVPILVGLALSPALRADVHLMNRLSRVDWEWLRRPERRVARLAVGKFNGGQKLAAAVMAGAGLVLFATGLLLIAPARINLPVGVRQGATIVHDLFTFGLLALLAGHLWMAWRHPEARAAMRTGWVDRRYAQQQHAAWVADQR